ncbi:MAG: GNAT family N-acetyltransferase [Clostridia bacterium]|nr:GNAT family N-acetyltransferase [Clostridia bacterium]
MGGGNHLGELHLKEVNYEDAREEYRFLSDMPADENGMTNEWFGLDWTEFQEKVIQAMLDSAKGIGLPDGYVPETWLFLWDDCEIVGVFRIRHFLTDSLRNGSGHIGCTIRKDCRGKGLGTRGLELALKAADKLVEEDELYLRCQIDNAASLRMMLKNGASIHHSDGDHIFTRIPKKK